MQRGRRGAQVEHLVVGEGRHLRQRVGGQPPGRQVVGDHQLQLVVDLAVELVELQAQQAGVDAELDDHRLDLVGDAVDHLAALDDGGHVAQRGGVLELGRQSG